MPTKEELLNLWPHFVIAICVGALVGLNAANLIHTRNAAETASMNRAACEEFAQIDDEIFDETAQAFASFDFTNLEDFARDKTPERTKAYEKCLGL